MIFSDQSGFRALHSVLKSLLKCTNDWYLNVDKGKYTAVVYIDLKKAFDTVDHDILLRKLNFCRPEGKELSWFTLRLHMLDVVYILNRHKYIGPLNELKLGDQTIEYAHTSECLGVLIDSKLSWKPQIKSIRKSFSAKVKELKNLKYLSQNFLEEIYFTTEIPTVTYAIAAWGTCSESQGRRHGVDWGGHVHPTILRSVFIPKQK